MTTTEIVMNQPFILLWMVNAHCCAELVDGEKEVKARYQWLCTQYNNVEMRPLGTFEMWVPPSPERN